MVGAGRLDRGVPGEPARLWPAFRGRAHRLRRGAKLRQVNPDGTAIIGIADFGPTLSFSPDGRLIAFAARDTAVPDRSAIFVASTAGGKARRITDLGVGNHDRVLVARWRLHPVRSE